MLDLTFMFIPLRKTGFWKTEFEYIIYNMPLGLNCKPVTYFYVKIRS